MYTMLILSLLLASACLGAPPVGPDIHVHTEDTPVHTEDTPVHTEDIHVHTEDTHVHTEDTHVHTEDTHVHTEDVCTKSSCRVSNDTLDSALETFLCMKDDDIRGLREKEKKRVLAQKIAPLLKMNEDGSSVADILAEMDTARLVPIVNLVLHDHDGDAAVEPKTELEYTSALREGLSSATSLQPSSFRRTSPIVLGFLNCQVKLLSKLHDLVLGAQREGRVYSKRKCTVGRPCAEGEGDCDNKLMGRDCQRGLYCGKNNCKGQFNLRGSVDKDDCCTWHLNYCDPRDILPSSRGRCCSPDPDEQCPAGHGDCDTDDDCRPGLKCGENNCKQFHPYARENDDCCVSRNPTPAPAWRRCQSYSPCGLGEGDCSGDETCRGNLVCGENNCRDLHPTADPKMDCCEERRWPYY